MQSHYRPDIDGLRAFSIIAVVLFHAWPTLLPGGFVGVDIFFVISGYLITGILLRSIDGDRFSLARFYRRRIQRILPALLLVLTGTLALGWWLLLPYEYAQLGKHTAGAAVFAPNLVFWNEAGYFDTDSKLKPLLHLWSLGVEEQFYLTWPLLLSFAGLAGRRYLIICLGLLLASLLASLWWTGDPAGSFFLPWFRAWELLLGGVLAIVQRRRLQARRSAWSLLGLALMVAATVLVHEGRSFPGAWALLPTVGAALVIAAGPTASVNRLLSLPLLVWIGRISFPLYLWHWPLLTLLRITEDGTASAALRGAAVALSIVLAWLSYRLVEQPLRYHPGRWVAPLLVAALFTLGVAGWQIYRHDGLPQRMPPASLAATDLHWNELGLHERDDCAQQLGLPGRCLRDGKPATIAVLGDSHSTNVFFALAHHYRERPEGVMRLGMGGCPPLAGIAIADSGNADRCRDSFAAQLNWVLANPAIDTVYLSSLGPMYLHDGGRFTLHDPARPQVTGNAELFAAGLEASLLQLAAAGKSVVLVIDWPALGMDPRLCVDTRPVRLGQFETATCSRPAARYLKRNRSYRTLVTALWQRYPGTLLWDTATAFCDGTQCRGMSGGRLLYRDPAHLSLAGSQYLGEQLQLQASAAPD